MSLALARSRSNFTLVAWLALSSVGCSGNASDDELEESRGPLYAVMYEVYDDAGSTSYLSLLDSLDIDEIDVERAREFGSGRAFIQSYGGKLFVGDSESPTVTRYSIGTSGEPVFEDSMSFANYGLVEGQFDDWNVTFISEDKAYLLDTREGTTIVWNPSTLEIVGDIPAPAELYREGWSLETTPGVVRDGLLFRTFDWANYDEAAYVPDFLLAIYDVATDELLELVEETRCPVPGNLVQEDEAGTLYFSNWVWPVAGTLMRGAASPCVLRINAGERRFDPNWTLDYGDVTDGREGAMFTYLENGQALVAAFHDERTSFDETTDPWSYVGSNNWRVWNVDMGTMTGSPLEGLDFNGGGVTPIEFDGRLLLMVPGGAEDNWATQVHEVVGGRASPRARLPGWSYQFEKLR